MTVNFGFPRPLVVPFTALAAAYDFFFFFFFQILLAETDVCSASWSEVIDEKQFLPCLDLDSAYFVGSSVGVVRHK